MRNVGSANASRRNTLIATSLFSLVSRALNVLGLYLGPEEHLMRPSSDNPAGHWENRPIKQINDEILSILGGSWSAPPPLPPGWERCPYMVAAG